MVVLMDSLFLSQSTCAPAQEANLTFVGKLHFTRHITLAYYDQLKFKTLVQIQTWPIDHF